MHDLPSKESEADTSSYMLGLRSVAWSYVATLRTNVKVKVNRRRQTDTSTKAATCILLVRLLSAGQRFQTSMQLLLLSVCNVATQADGTLLVLQMQHLLCPLALLGCCGHLLNGEYPSTCFYHVCTSFHTPTSPLPFAPTPTPPPTSTLAEGPVLGIGQWM